MICFEKAYFLFSTNTLARVLGADKDKLEEDELVNRAAMNTRLQRFKFEASYANGSKQPFDAAGIALALRYLYDTYQPNEVVEAKPLCTQIQYPDFPKPKNPIPVQLEPSTSSSSGPKPIPKQAMYEKDRTIATLQAKVA